MSDSGAVCVLGLGLIGGSLLRALASDSAAPSPTAVYGWNRSADTVQAAQTDGFDVSDDLRRTLHRARTDDAIVVVAVPLTAIDNTFAQIAAHCPATLVTDVVSVKAPVAALAEKHRLRFIGGHPMAGTSHSGWPATDPHLFSGATWVIALGNPPPLPEDFTRIYAMAARTGAVVVAADPVEHDSAVARISHVPHLLAAATARLGATDDALALRLAAGSFRDGTRVAGTAPTLTAAMCDGNREAVLAGLDEAIGWLTEVKSTLEKGESTIAAAREGYLARERFEQARGQAESLTRRIDLREANWAAEALAAGRLGRSIDLGGASSTSAHSSRSRLPQTGHH